MENKDSGQTGFKQNNGSDPAMPVQGVRQDGDAHRLYGQLFHGLTKREHFAGLAMQGMIANPLAVEKLGVKDLVLEAVTLADALLAALEKSK